MDLDEPNNDIDMDLDSLTQKLSNLETDPDDEGSEENIDESLEDYFEALETYLSDKDEGSFATSDLRDEGLILIQKGANVNYVSRKTGKSFLYYAVDSLGLSFVKELVKRKAYIDMPNNDRYGFTPLFSAVSSSKYDIIEYLLIKRANVNAMNKKFRTVIYYINMINYENLSITSEDDPNKDYALKESLINYLIQFGLNINTEDIKKITPLEHAITRHEPLKFRALIRNGAYLNVYSPHLRRNLLSYAYDIYNRRLMEDEFEIIEENSSVLNYLESVEFCKKRIYTVSRLLHQRGKVLNVIFNIIIELIPISTHLFTDEVIKKIIELVSFRDSLFKINVIEDNKDENDNNLSIDQMLQKLDEFNKENKMNKRRR